MQYLNSHYVFKANSYMYECYVCNIQLHVTINFYNEASSLSMLCPIRVKYSFIFSHHTSLWSLLSSRACRIFLFPQSLFLILSVYTEGYLFIRWPNLPAESRRWACLPVYSVRWKRFVGNKKNRSDTQKNQLYKDLEQVPL